MWVTLEYGAALYYAGYTCPLPAAYPRQALLKTLGQFNILGKLIMAEEQSTSQLPDVELGLTVCGVAVRGASGRWGYSLAAAEHQEFYLTSDL